MSKLPIGLRIYTIYLRWIILLIFVLIHVKWDKVYSVGYSLIIAYNLLFTYLHFKKCKSAVWRAALLIEIVSLILVNGFVILKIDQLLYLYLTFLLIDFVFSRVKSFLLCFAFSIFSAFMTYKLYPQHDFVENLYPLSFLCGFILYLLFAYLMYNIANYFKKWIIILRYLDILSQMHTFKALHRLTENYINKLLMIPKCYLCMYSNNNSIDDWHNQYYSRVLQGHPISKSAKKRRAIKLENYLGEQSPFLLLPIRLYRPDQNLGGLLIPLGKKPPPNQFELILLRILLSSFVNQWRQLVQLQDQANAIKAEVREKLAQDIHDGLAQQLFFLSAQIFQIKNTVSKINAPHLESMISKLEHQAMSSQNEVREFIAHLKGERKQSNIFEAIHQLVKRLTYNSAVNITLDYSGESFVESVEIEETVFRIIEETINNILKHAKATTIKVIVEPTIVQWTIKIVDDGVGFDLFSKSEHKSYGLKGLRERIDHLGGHLTLSSSVGKGTKVLAIIPRGGIKAYV
jgi:signal transduction histidine kinase